GRAIPPRLPCRGPVGRGVTALADRLFVISPLFPGVRPKTDADRQSTRSQGPEDAQGEDEDTRACRLAAEARRLHARIHNHPEEAELGPPEGGSCPPDERDGGRRVHPG